MLARPVARDQLDPPGIRLVQRRVVENQGGADELDQRSGFLPQGGGVGLDAVEQPGGALVGPLRQERPLARRWPPYNWRPGAVR